MKSFIKSIILGIKGFIMGAANIIPGVSGGTLAIILGIYEKLIDILSAFWKNFVENLKFLIPLLIGAALALVAGSYVINWGLDNHPFATTMLFIGLVIGGIPFIFKKVHKKANWINILVFIIVAAIVVLICILKGEREISFEKLDFLSIVKLFFVGVIAAATMIVPGISGSFVMMTIGYYNGIIAAIKDLFSFTNVGHNICILLPFGVGVIVGLILVARLIKFLLQKFPIQSYFAILAFILASIFGIIYQMKIESISALEIVVGIILLIGGAIATFYLAWYDEKRNKAEEKETETIEEDNEKMLSE